MKTSTLILAALGVYVAAMTMSYWDLYYGPNRVK